MVPLRLDDLGASSKYWERWSRHRWANIWPLHDRRLFGAWGPYRELTAVELDHIARTVARCGRTMTFAITPIWIETDGSLTVYPRKFPQQAEVVRLWVAGGTVEVAAHGLFHCQPGEHRPRWIGGNRPQHRNQCVRRAAMGCLARELDVPVTRYVAPGEPAGTTPERVFHDREFVLDWDRALRALTEALK